MAHLNKTVAFRLAGMLAVSLTRLTVAELESIARLAVRESSARKLEALTCFSKVLAAPHTNLEHTGEFGLIERIAQLAFGVAFDVGANIGNWSQHFCNVNLSAEVHCFEIVPETFARLRKRFDKNAARIVLNSFGLSDEEGMIGIFISDDDLVSSIYERVDGRAKRRLTCRVRRGDDYARERGIERIDFLKIDVEGAEGRVLQGMADYFDRGQVRLVQFEFNEFSIESHFLLKDFYRFLSERGYIVGRLTPGG